jgi:hypothetical protein
MGTKKPTCVVCPTCKAPAVNESSRIKHVDLLTPLEELVRVIKEFRCGDYSPIMDEVFDAEHAIRLAKKKPQRGIDY